MPAISFAVPTSTGSCTTRSWRSARPAATAFDLSERARSRSLLELLGGTAVLRADGIPPPLVERERAELADVRTRVAAGAAAGKQVAALARLRAARDRLAATWRELAATGARGAEYAQVRRGDPVSFADIGPLVGDAVLAEYHVTPDAVVMLVARAGDTEPVVHRVPLTRADLVELVNGAFDADADTVRGADLDSWTALRPLVEPLLRHSDPGAVVWLVPHDVLHGVPLHAIEVEGGPLVLRNPVCYAAAASVMRYCQANHREAGGSVLLADSLPERPLLHSRGQSKAVAELLERPTHLVGLAATVTAMTRAVADGVSVLHIACHGEFDAEAPARSRVLLAADGDDDGVLTTERVLAVPLPADLVVLSACQSGVAQRTQGDELLGLTRALIYAGASAVPVSLWSVDEVATGLLMYSFYTARAAGQGKADALRTAQLAVRDVTAEQVIAYCAEVTAEPEVLARDIADTRSRAGDFTAAAQDYSELLDRSDEDDPELLAAHNRAALAALGRASGADYTRRIYAHPFHWAAFVLIGDWR